jgi:two-component system, OmpR family, sensor kinase
VRLPYLRFAGAWSIRARLFAVFLLLFLLVMFLGVQSLNSLNYSNEVSKQVRVRWLPSTRALGDLNNYTTDFPAAVAAVLRSRTEDEKATLRRQLSALDRNILGAEQAYRQIVHDPTEDEMYGRFEAEWRSYRAVVSRIELLPLGGGDESETRSLVGSTEGLYERASETLGQLTERNLASAREASQSSDRAYGQARRRIVLTILFAGLFAAGAALHVTRSVSAPLVELASRMHRLAANDTHIEVLGTARRDEIGEMARAVVVFKNNAIDLSENRQALAHQASMLQEKLSEEQRVTLLQRNFVSMASHEFRTPLGIIDGHAQRLITMRDRLTPEDLAERARKIRSAAQRMTQLIDNLIGSARLIDGSIEAYYRPVAVDAMAVLREACHMQRELTPNAQILESDSTAPLLVRGDAHLLLQLFGNLLSNAVKYSPSGGLICLRARPEGGSLAVAIEDSGIGVPEKDQLRLFERYFRGSNTSGIAGTGVGLYLVSRIVELHGGTVNVRTREGAGSTFTVHLPVIRSPSPSEEILTPQLRMEH